MDVRIIVIVIIRMIEKPQLSITWEIAKSYYSKLSSPKSQEIKKNQGEIQLRKPWYVLSTILEILPVWLQCVHFNYVNFKGHWPIIIYSSLTLVHYYRLVLLLLLHHTFFITLLLLSIHSSLLLWHSSVYITSILVVRMRLNEFTNKDRRSWNNSRQRSSHLLLLSST